MSTAIETRDVLSKVEGVIRVHPDGLGGKAIVYVRDKKQVSQEAFQEALAGTEKLRFRKMKETRG